MGPGLPAQGAIIAAKLLPQHSARWTSRHGDEEAAYLGTKPFLALSTWYDCLWKTKPSLDEAFRDPVLFIVSPVKPHGVYEGCFLTLIPSATSSLREIQLEPYPMNHVAPLFLHTRPTLSVGQMKNMPFVSSYQLSGDALERIGNAYSRDFEITTARAGYMFPPKSGGENEVDDEWDSWSGQSAKENLTNPYHQSYEVLPLLDEYWTMLPSIHQELSLLRQ
jgi:casein kinase 1